MGGVSRGGGGVECVGVGVGVGVLGGGLGGGRGRGAGMFCFLCAVEGWGLTADHGPVQLLGSARAEDPNECQDWQSESTLCWRCKWLVARGALFFKANVLLAELGQNHAGRIHRQNSVEWLAMQGCTGIIYVRLQRHNIALCW